MFTYQNNLSMAERKKTENSRLESVQASVAGRGLCWPARANRWLSVPQTSHTFEIKFFEDQSRHGDEVYLQRWALQGCTCACGFRTPLVLRGSCGCPSQTPKAGHCQLRMRPAPPWSAPEPLSFCQKPKQVHKFLSLSPLHAFQPPGKTGGVPAGCWETQLSLKSELSDWSLWCFQSQLFHDVFAFISSFFQEEILRLM